MTTISGRVLVEGRAIGTVLVLDEPLSFWGGLDASTGQIIDTSHPQHGHNVRGRILALFGSRGSSGTPGVLGEALRAGVGPAAIVLTKADANLVAGALVARALYGVSCPIVQVDDVTFSALRSGQARSVGSETR